MPGIEEAERMERNWLKRFYEDNVVLWSLVLLVLGAILSAATGFIVNLGKPPVVINVPEQKPPIVNIVMPEQKKPDPIPKKK